MRLKPFDPHGSAFPRFLLPKATTTITPLELTFVNRRTLRSFSGCLNGVYQYPFWVKSGTVSSNKELWYLCSRFDVYVVVKFCVKIAFETCNDSFCYSVPLTLDQHRWFIEFKSWPGPCVVFMTKTLYSHSASVHPGEQMRYTGGGGGGEEGEGQQPAMDHHPI